MAFQRSSSEFPPKVTVNTPFLCKPDEKLDRRKLYGLTPRMVGHCTGRSFPSHELSAPPLLLLEKPKLASSHAFP